MSFSAPGLASRGSDDDKKQGAQLWLLPRGGDRSGLAGQ
jgi:hypothetical protein